MDNNNNNNDKYIDYNSMIAPTTLSKETADYIKTQCGYPNDIHPTYTYSNDIKHIKFYSFLSILIAILISMGITAGIIALVFLIVMFI